MPDSITIQDARKTLLQVKTTEINGLQIPHHIVESLPLESLWVSYRNAGTLSTEVIKSTPGYLHSLAVYNKDPFSLYFWQLFDLTVAPTTGTAPIESYAIAPQTMLVLDSDFFGPRGRPLSSGITWGFSSTEATYAAAPVGSHSTHVKYE